MFELSGSPYLVNVPQEVADRVIESIVAKTGCSLAVAQEILKAHTTAIVSVGLEVLAKMSPDDLQPFVDASQRRRKAERN